MSLEAPAYLASLQNNVRQRPIPWDGAVRAGLVTEGQLSKIRSVDRAKKKEAKKEAIEQDLDSYTELFVGDAGKPSVLESAAKQPNMVQYLLVLLDDMVNCAPSLATSLLESDNPYRSFLPLLHHSRNPEDPIPLLTSQALTTIMSAARDESPATKKALPESFKYLSGLMESNDASKQDIAVQQYSNLLYCKASRQQFWKQREETIAPMVEVLRSATGLNTSSSTASLWSGTASLRTTGNESQMSGGVGLQLLYHILLVMWQLSFDADTIGDDLNDEYDIVLLYTQLLRISPKEKTSRLIIGTLWHLLEQNQKTLLPSAVLARLPSLLGNVGGRHFTDPDLLENLEALNELLEEYTKTKTTFDEYVAEVETGHLRWSPPHRNALFWAENCRKILEFNNGEIPRKLTDIMSKSWDNDKAVLAIACNDIGWLVREAPERRQQLEKLGLKRRVMALMDEADENVRWESLRALGSWLKYSFESTK